MASTQINTTRLSEAVEQAKVEADRLGSDASQISSMLAELVTMVQAISANSGHLDEGIRPEDLTTENDR